MRSNERDEKYSAAEALGLSRAPFLLKSSQYKDHDFGLAPKPINFGDLAAKLDDTTAAAKSGTAQCPGPASPWRKQPSATVTL